MGCTARYRLDQGHNFQSSPHFKMLSKTDIRGCIACGYNAGYCKHAGLIHQCAEPDCINGIGAKWATLPD